MKISRLIKTECCLLTEGAIIERIRRSGDAFRIRTASADRNHNALFPLLYRALIDPFPG